MATLTKSTGTVTLSGAAEKVTLPASYGWVWVKNMSEGDIFAGLSEDISEGADGVMVIPSGECGRIQADGFNSVYLLGTGNALVVAQNYADCPFKVGGKGGEIPDLSAYAKTADVPNIKVNEAVNAENLSNWVGLYQENLDDAPLGFCNAHGGTVNTPFEFWSTVITTGNEKYRQQIAFPWAEGETYIMPKLRVMDNGVWYSWKQCNPIRSTDVSGSTDEYGSLLLWSIDGGIPISAVGDGNRIFTPFNGAENNYYLTVRDLAGNAIANTTASATVFFI